MLLSFFRRAEVKETSTLRWRPSLRLSKHGMAHFSHAEHALYVSTRRVTLIRVVERVGTQKLLSPSGGSSQQTAYFSLFGKGEFPD